MWPWENCWILFWALVCLFEIGDNNKLSKYFSRDKIVWYMELQHSKQIIIINNVFLKLGALKPEQQGSSKWQPSPLDEGANVGVQMWAPLLWNRSTSGCLCAQWWEEAQPVQEQWARKKQKSQSHTITLKDTVSNDLEIYDSRKKGAFFPPVLVTWFLVPSMCCGSRWFLWCESVNLVYFLVGLLRLW